MCVLSVFPFGAIRRLHSQIIISENKCNLYFKHNLVLLQGFILLNSLKFRKHSL